jgi:hypothetical protein
MLADNMTDQPPDVKLRVGEPQSLEAEFAPRWFDDIPTTRYTLSVRAAPGARLMDDAPEWQNQTNPSNFFKSNA